MIPRPDPISTERQSLLEQLGVYMTDLHQARQNVDWLALESAALNVKQTARQLYLNEQKNP